jgi:hypothetical protein
LKLGSEVLNENVSQKRWSGLDAVRGVAVILMLVDHTLVVVQVRHEWVAWLRIGLTRPALPLFMIVSGTLLDVRPRFRHQAERILPWALASSIAAAYVPGFGFPEPLTMYLLALPIVWVAWRFDALWLALVIMVLMAVQGGLWPLPSYSPWEMAAWLLVGMLMHRRAGDREWWKPSAMTVARNPWLDLSRYRWLCWCGRHSLILYSAQLVGLAVVAAVLGIRGYLL